jgi:TPR repeat protein
MAEIAGRANAEGAFEAVPPPMHQRDLFALVPRVRTQLERAEPGAKRVLARIVEDALALASRRDELPFEESPASLYERGLDLHYGRGPAKNLTEAAALIRQAASKGLVEAQYSLGVLLENGRGLVKDCIEAAKWYRLAAERVLRKLRTATAGCFPKAAAYLRTMSKP